MTQEQFDALVGELEGLARKQPGTYKLRVGLLAVLGYVYIFLILVGILALLALLVGMVFWSGRINVYMIKGGIVLLVPMFVILRSLWVSFPPPQGLELSRKQVPQLFALVDELTSKLQAPRFHRILMTEEFNAGVAQRPRLGIFGWQQNYLVVGLPLMQALSPNQFRAVLAHELGHLSGNHSRFSGWIYRVQQTYYQMLERLHQGGHQGSFAVFERFFNWYAPFFAAYSFVLRRANEYEADRCAAELAGATTTAEALINVEVKSKYLESDFWPNIFKQVNNQVEPPATTFTSMSGVLRSNLTSENATRWIDEALREKTSNADTHPCLADRLSALKYLPAQGQQLPLPAPVKVSAAQEFLGDGLKQLTEYFDRTWKEGVATPWRQRYAYAQEAQKNLQSLEEKAQNQQLTAEEAWNRACWTAEFKGKETAIPLFQDLLAAEPDRADANYALGQILLQKHDSSGISYIEKAMGKDSDSVMPGCELIYYFLKQQGKIEEAKTYQKRLEKHYELVLMAQQERSFVSESDKFEHHNLADESIKNLCQQLSRYEQIKEGYLVRKAVNYFPEKPFYVLGVVRRQAWWKIHTSDQDTKLLNKLISEIEFPGQAYVIILNDSQGYSGQIKKLVSKIEGALIYRR